MKRFLQILLVLFFYIKSEAQIGKKVVFDFGKDPRRIEKLDTIKVFHNNTLERLLVNVPVPFDYTILHNGRYRFEFYNSCCNTLTKIIDPDTIESSQVFSLRFWERVINLRELKIKAVRERFSQSGDTLFIFTNPEDTRPHATATSLFDRVVGLNNFFGRISVLGKTVQEVTIDGKRIFGGMPSFSLDAIKADMIEHMEFIENNLPNGQTVSVLNVKLKNDKKHKSYGNLSAGAGIHREHLISSSYNNISSSNFLNVFFTSNNINQRGIDLKTLDNLRMHSFRNGMNKSGSVIGLFDGDKVEVNDNFSAFENKLQGENRYTDLGLNYSFTRPKFVANTFLFANYLAAKVNKGELSEATFGDLVQMTNNKQENSIKDKKLNSNVIITWNPNSRVTFSFSDFLNVSKGVQDRDERTSNLINVDQLTSNSIGKSRNSNYLFENNVYSSLIIRGKRPGTLSSVLVTHHFQKMLDDKNFENSVMFHNTNFNQIGNQSIQPLLRSGSVQLNQSKPISKHILIEFKAKFTQVLNSNQLINNRPDIDEDQDVNERNQLFETGIFALYQKRKFKIISGINYFHWSIYREKNESVFSNKPNLLLNPFTKLQTQIGKIPLWFRLATDVSRPSWNVVGSLPDSSGIYSLTDGNIFTSNYIHKNLQLGTTLNFKKGYTSNFSLTYSKYISPVINDNTYNPVLNIVSSTFVNSKEPNTSINVSATIFRINMNSKFSFFYFGNYMRLKNHQQINETISKLEAEILTNNIITSYKLSKNSIFKFDWRSQLNWLNAGLVFNNDLILSNDLDFWEKWHLDSRLNFAFNKTLNNQLNSQQFIDIELGKYFLKRNNFKGSFFVKNVLNVKDRVMIHQSSNFQSYQTVNQLPRVIGFQFTIYPETFR